MVAKKVGQKNEDQYDKEEIYDDGPEEVVSDQEDMNGFSKEDVEYVGGSGEESDSDSGSNSEAHLKDENFSDDESSDEDSDVFITMTTKI